MTGIITSIPPLVEQPPGNNANNPAGLPGVTYTAAIPTLSQTWTGLQTFTNGSMKFAGSISGYTFLNATAIASGTVSLPAIVGTDTLLSNNNVAVVTNKSIDGLTNTITNVPTGSLDPDLQALAALTGTGLATRTAADTWAIRTITAGASIGVTNGDGVSGNPTIAVTDAELVALAGLTSAADKLPYFTGSGTASLADFSAFARTLVDDTTQGAMQTTLGLVPGTNVQAFDSDLAALAANSGTGLWAVTGAGTGSVRTITGPAAGITVSNGGGVAGNPTLALANDLSALEGLASTGIAVRTTTDTWAQRTLQPPAAGVTISNPAGVAGDPTFSLANDLSALEGLSSTGIARRTATDTWSVGTAVSNAELATMAAFTFKGNNTSGSATPTDVDIAALTTKASPAAGDYIMLSDQAASGAWKKATVSSVSAAGSVASLGGQTGALTFDGGSMSSTVMTVLRYDAAQSLTAAQQAQASVNGNVTSALQNLCTNPGMQVWQNDTTLAAMAHRTVLADGFLFGNVLGSSVWTGTRETSSLPDAKVPAKIKVQVTTAEASPAAGVDRHIRWAVYGKDFEPWANSNIKIRFLARAKKTGIHSVAVVNELRDRAYVVEYTISAADTWETKEVTIPFGTKTGTWNTGDGFGFGIRWALVTGTTYQTTAGAWQTGNYGGSTNQVNVGDNTANYFEMTEIDVYPENVPAFSLPTYDEALASALRQYRVLTVDTGGVNIIGFAATADVLNFDIPIFPPMMAPPTISTKGTYDTDIQVQNAGGTAITGSTLGSFARSKHFAKWQMNKTGAYTTNQVYLFRFVTTSGKLVIDGHLQ